MINPSCTYSHSTLLLEKKKKKKGRVEKSDVEITVALDRYDSQRFIET